MQYFNLASSEASSDKDNTKQDLIDKLQSKILIF